MAARKLYLNINEKFSEHYPDDKACQKSFENEKCSYQEEI